MSLLEINDLRVDFSTVDGDVHAVRGLSYSLERGQTLGIVGESGSGKTVSSLAVMGLLPGNGRVTSGSILFDGDDVLAYSKSQLRDLRGRRVSMIFQDPMTALNPVETVGRQIGNTISYHHKSATRREIDRRVVETLESVGVPQAETRARQYPHQWSGGMRQRAVISMAIINEPDLIIADEPTTALDATVQAQVLDVLTRIREERDCAIILITHDLGVVRDIADDVLVMYAGAASEYAPTETVFEDPRHPYTRALIKARPGWGERAERLFTIPGRPPDLLQEPTGCPFAPRCAERDGLERCLTEVPLPRTITPGHEAACHRADDLAHVEDALHSPEVGAATDVDPETEEA